MSTILVVEDEPNVRKLVSVNLVKRGYKVLEAENGQQAWEYLTSQKPDLLILDIKLPDVTGWEILDELGKLPHLSNDLPVLVMTASPVDIHAAINKYPCIVEVLVKPFNTDRLIKIVQRVLP